MGIFKNIFGQDKIKTGSSFKRNYRPDSLHRILRRAKVRYPATFGNLSRKELDKIEKLITRYAKRLSTSMGFPYHTKYRMKLDAHKLYKKGEISYEDLKDFKRIIDAL
jgi:hypothetical protein